MVLYTKIPELVTKYSTPLMVVEEACLRKTIRKFVCAFKQYRKNVQVSYSYKTNPLLAICQVMHQEGLWAEVVTGNELGKARKLGVPYSEIVFNGPDKTPEELKLAIKERVILNVDNWNELERIEEIARAFSIKAAIGLRVSLGYNAGYFSGPDSKFGFALETREIHRAIAKVINSEVLALEGLHFHLGTNITQVEYYQKAIAQVGGIVQELLAPEQRTLRYLDVGGGFPAASHRPRGISPQEWPVPEISEFATAICTAVGKVFPEETLLLVEPGRALVADSMSFVTQVISVKERSPQMLAIVDGGLNLIPSAEYIDHGFEIISTAQSSEKRASDGVKSVKILGPQCFSCDIVGLLEKTEVPRVGDLVVFQSIGAYNYCDYVVSCRDKPPIILLREDGSLVVIRDKEPYDALLHLEHLL